MTHTDQFTLDITSSLSSEPTWNHGLTLIILLSGNIQLQVGSQIYALSPHDIIFFKPYEMFCLLNSGGAYRAFVLNIKQEFLAQACPELDKIDFSIHLLRANHESPVYTSLCSSLSQFVHCTLKKDAAASPKKLLFLCDTISLLIENFGEDLSQDDFPFSADQSQYRISKILRYISEHYAEDISLRDISSQVGLHPQYFSSYFKKHFAATFTEYLNSYRINRSIPDLLSGRGTILDVAIAHGFNNHKTYGSVFRKVFGCSPREFRKINDHSDTPALEESLKNDLSFFQSFWKSDKETATPQPSLRNNLMISLEPNQQNIPKNTVKNFITVGRAVFCLRSNIQAQLRKAKIDLNLEFVRIRDIFSDDLFVYYEDEAKNPVFSWTALDEVFDFLLSIGVKPYAELGYMPSQMASKHQFAGWQYHPNVSFPKSMTLWKSLLTNFFKHLIYRYGAEAVRSWKFDFWTSPNLKLDSSYWYESKEMFFQFYESSYRAIKKIDSQIQLASPNFSYPAGLEWYQDFFCFAKQKHIIPDFVSARIYSYPDSQDGGKAEFLRYDPSGKGKQGNQIAPQKGLLKAAVHDIQNLLNSSGFGNLKIVVSDWNVTFFPTDFTRDTAFMGPYILDTYFQNYPYIEGLSYTALSDCNEDFFSSDLLFHGGPGIFDQHGIPKASYYALSFANRLSKDILQKGKNYVLSKTEKGVDFILYNLDFYHSNYHSTDMSALSYLQRYNVFEGVHTLNCHLSIPVEPGVYEVTRYRVSRSSGSSYDMWLKMGAPSELSHELAVYLQSSCIPSIYFETLTAADVLHLEEVVDPHGFSYISIQRKL